MLLEAPQNEPSSQQSLEQRNPTIDFVFLGSEVIDALINNNQLQVELPIVFSNTQVAVPVVQSLVQNVPLLDSHEHGAAVLFDHHQENAPVLNNEQPIPFNRQWHIFDPTVNVEQDLIPYYSNQRFAAMLLNPLLDMGSFVFNNEEQIVPSMPQANGPANEVVSQVRAVREFRDDQTGHIYRNELSNPLGSGGCGRVFQVVDSQGQHRALKLSKNKNATYMVWREVRFMRRLEERGGHVNIAKFRNVIQNDVDGVCLLFDLYLPKDFYQLLASRGALLDPETRYFGKQLIQGLKFIHSAGVIHCDFKPENVLVDGDMVLKISDFGHAEYGDEKVPRIGPTGTPAYAAPEIARGGHHTYKLDVYSLGCTIFMMLTGSRPGLTDGFKLCDFTPGNKEKFMSVCPEAQNLISQVLEKEPVKRLGLGGILRHDFFQRGYCPIELKKDVFNTPPTFSEEDKRKNSDESGSNEEDVQDNKRIKRDKTQEAGKGCGGKGKELLRGPVSNSLSVLKKQVRALRAQKQQEQRQLEALTRLCAGTNKKLEELEEKLREKRRGVAGQGCSSLEAGPSNISSSSETSNGTSSSTSLSSSSSSPSSNGRDKSVPFSIVDSEDS